MRRQLSLLLCVLISGLSVAWPSMAAEQRVQFSEQWKLDEPWTGDYDGMKERRIIRVLVAYSKIGFFFDNGRIRGTAHDSLMEFEDVINKKEGLRKRKIKVVFIPVPRDRLLPGLVEGRGDIAVANLTITPERQKRVDFSDPVLTNVKEILVTGPAAPAISDLNSLSGQQIHVRKSSSYYKHLIRLNDSLTKHSKPPIQLIPASEYFEDSDLLEMVNAGLIPMIIVDDHKARFWVDIFPKISMHPEIYINSGGNIAWAFRKNSPLLKATVNAFVKTHRKSTLLGNIVYKRYLKENKWARQAMDPSEQKKYQVVADLFKQYAGQYAFDYLMIVALAYQESQLDNRKRSDAGAIGIMQMLPDTARDKNVDIPDIEELENNIHAGVKYLRFLHDRYFDDPAVDILNRNLFTFAAYNAGPAKITRLRNDAKAMGLDPNVWFGNVEVVAARHIGRETVQYVSNIYKYYVAYKLVRRELDTKKRLEAIAK